jgi:YfiR/HmsC-like
MNIRLQARNDKRARREWRLVATTNTRLIRRMFFLMLACWLFLNPARALSLNNDEEEYALKLACLYNFTKFVEWPADSYRDAGAPLAICVIGDDPFEPDLEGELRTRKAGSHPVEVKMLTSNDTLTSCHIVFVPAAEKSHAIRIVTAVKGSSTLTVGETDGFAALGGIINLTVENNKLHFEVNRLAAERAGLTISSKLLNLAKIVQ